MFKSLFTLLFCCIAIPTQASESVRVFHPFLGPLGEAFETLIKDIFPDASLSTTMPNGKPTSYEGIHTAVMTGTLPHPLPDVVHVYEMGAKDCETQQDLIPLFEFFDEVAQITGERKTIDVREITPTLRDFYSVNGKLYALPFNSNTAIVFVNKSLWGNRPLPQTWEAFEEAAKEYQTSHPAQPVIAFGWIHGHLFDQSGAIHGIELATFNNGNHGTPSMNLNNPFWEKWLETLKRLYNKGLISLSDKTDAEALFNQGKIPFLSQGTNRLPFIKLDPSQVDVMMIPKMEASDRYNSISGGGAFWIHRHVLDAYKMAKSADAKKEALDKLKKIREFIMILASEKVQNTWEVQTGYLSVLKGRKNLQYPSLLHEKVAFVGRMSREECKESPNSVGIKVPKYQDIRAIQQDTLKAYLMQNLDYVKANESYFSGFDGKSISAKQALELIQNKVNQTVLSTN